MIDHNDRDDSPGESPHDTSFDPESDSVSEELLSTLTDLRNADPTELELLTDSIDADALNTLFDARTDRSRPNSDLYVEFEYSGHTIGVRNDGTITIYSNTDTED